MEGNSSAEPSFVEMDPSRGWCFLDLPSELLVGPSLDDWFSTPVVTPLLHECDLPFAGDETNCGVLIKFASDISVFETLGHAMVRPLSVAGLVTSFNALMGLDEFWGVYMFAAVAAAFCFAATWLWIAQEGPHPFWSFFILWFSLDFQLTLRWFATLAAAVAALWEVGAMEADVLLVANKRYVRNEDKKHFLKVLQHTAILTAAVVVSAAAWWAADQKYLAIAAAACCVAFFLPVVLELFFGFDVVSFAIEAVRVRAFCFSDIDMNCEFESEQHCSAAAASEYV